MVPGTINAYQYVFPVVAGDAPTQESPFLVREVYGSAFSIGDGAFISNEHVIRAASSHDWWGIGYPGGEHWHAAKVDRSETWSEFDVGILTADVDVAKQFRWKRPAEEAMLTEVLATGFPYALDLSSFTLSIRSFRGTVISARTWGGLASTPRVYELSFPCPRGLSGAPLLEVGLSRVLGIVFGNAITEMVVYSERETIAEAQQTSLYEKTEAMHLGLAIQSKSILAIKSEMLGASLEEYLRERGLVED